MQIINSDRITELTLRKLTKTHKIRKEEQDRCNDLPRRYDITTLNHKKLQFLNENSVNLLPQTLNHVS